MSFKDEIDTLKNYDVEVPGDAFAVPREDGVLFKKVWGTTIINDECPACWGKGKVTDPGIRQIAPGLVKKVPSEVVTCPLCDGTGKFDYSKAEIKECEDEEKE